MKLFYSVLFFLSLSVGLFADPFDGNRVPENAQWFAHVDMQVFRATIAGKNLSSTKIVEKFCKNEASERLANLGIDPLRNARGVTIYGTDTQRHFWVLAYDGQFYLARILDLIQEKGSYEISSDNGIDLYSVHYENKMCYFFVHQGIFYCSQKLDMLQNHIQMIVGKKKSLLDLGYAVHAGANSFALLHTAERGGTFGTQPAPTSQELKADASFKERVMSSVLKVSATAQEDAGTLSSELVITTKDSEAAAAIQQYLQGLLVIAKVKRPRAKAVLDSAKISLEGANLTITGGLSSSDLLYFLDQYPH